MSVLTFLTGFIESRAEAHKQRIAVLGPERGVVVEWFMIAVVALAILAILIVAMPELAGNIVDALQENLLP